MRVLNGTIDVGAAMDVGSWHLLPYVQLQHYRPSGFRRRLWCVSAGWLCFHAWVANTYLERP